jgi:beta-lactamase regulating signal transducer with metallopeptidase domain
MKFLFSSWTVLELAFPSLAAMALLALKGFLIFAVAYIITQLLQNRSAIARNWIWRIAFIILAITPLWSHLPKAVEPFRPVIRTTPQLDLVSPILHSFTQTGLLLDIQQAQKSSKERIASLPPPDQLSPPWEHQSSSISSEDIRPSWSKSLDRWTGSALWIIGIFLIVWKIVRAALALSWLHRQTIDSHPEAAEITKKAATKLAMSSQFNIRCSIARNINIPLVTGWPKPHIWLPQSSTLWDHQKLLAVCLHETTHLKRRDGLWQWLASIITCCWWWNPFIWRALKHLKTEAELAADEIVLTHAIAAPAYAETLVDIAKSSSQNLPTPQVGLPILEPSSLEARIKAILANSFWRGKFDWKLRLITLVLLLAGALATGVAIDASGKPTEHLTAEQSRLAKELLDALKSRSEKLRFLHFVIEETWENANPQGGEASKSPLPSNIEVWTDEWQNMYRAEYHPSVTPWRDGAAPAVIEDRIDISDGRKTLSVDRWYDPNNKKEHKAYPLTLLTLHYEREAIEKLIMLLEHKTANHQHMRTFLRTVPEHSKDPKMVELVEEIGQWNNDPNALADQSKVWSFDLGRGAVLTAHQVTFSKNNASSTKLIVHQLASTSSNIAYPSEYTFTWQDRSTHRKVRSLEVLTSLPDHLLQPPADPSTPYVAADQGQVIRHPSLSFHCINTTTSLPEPNVTISANINKAGQPPLTSDAAGLVNIPLPDQPIASLVITATKTGFTPQRVSWIDDSSRLQLPDSYTLQIAPASPIGGRIVDESGVGISQAKVQVYLHRPRSSSKNFNDHPSLSKTKSTTDADGSWQLDGIPQNLRDLSIKIEHPDYLTAPASGGFIDYRMLTGKDYANLRDGTSRIVLNRGLTLKGIVADSTGQPIQGCQLSIGDDRWGRDLPSALTDANGAFSFKALQQGEFTLTAQSHQHAPFTRRITIPNPLPNPIRITLQPGNLLRAQVLREDGKPMANGIVGVDQWQLLRTLQYETKTDAQGFFEWRGAPPEEVTFYFSGHGDEEFLSRLPLKANVKGQIATLRPAIRFQGKVLDTKTGRPVTRFQITPGRNTGNSTYWEETQSFTTDTFTWQTRSMGDQPWCLRFEADGYEPYQTDFYPTQQQTETLAIKLTPQAR